MAIDKKTLQRFLDNPAQFTPEDMGLDQEGEKLAPNESSDGSMEIPEMNPEEDLVEQAPDIADPDEVNQENDLELDQEDPEMAPPKVAKQNLMQDASQQDAQEIAGDMKAPMELRRQALLKIKQKYLGQQNG